MHYSTWNKIAWCRDKAINLNTINVPVFYRPHVSRPLRLHAARLASPRRTCIVLSLWVCCCKVDISMLVMIYASVVVGYDRRIPGLSSAPYDSNTVYKSNSPLTHKITHISSHVYLHSLSLMCLLLNKYHMMSFRILFDILFTSFFRLIFCEFLFH